MNLIEHLSEIGIGRDEVLKLTDSDYVRLSKLIKLKFKKLEVQDMNSMSKLLDVLRDDLDNLKTVYANDMIYFTLSRDLINAKKSESICFPSEKDLALKGFISKYFKSDLMDVFGELVVNENYKELNAWMRIANIYPDELMSELKQLMIQDMDAVLENLSGKGELDLNEYGTKFLRSEDYYSILSIKNHPFVSDKINDLVNRIFIQFRNKKGRPTRVEFDLLCYIKSYKYLSEDSLKKIELVVEVYLKYGVDSSENVSNNKGIVRIVMGIVFLIFIVFIIKSIRIEPTVRTELIDATASNGYSAVKPKRYISEANFHFLILAGTTGSDCKKMYQLSCAKLVPHIKGNVFNYEEEQLGLKSGEMATMGLEIELPSVATGNDISFVNKSTQPVLIVIVRPNYIFSKKDLSILPGSGNDLASGRYYVEAGKRFKFDSRIKYFKIQTGEDLKQVKISGSSLKETFTGYAFCPFTDLDAMLFSLDINVKNSTKAVGGVMELTKSDSKYNLLWKGNDSTLFVYKDVYLKKNSTFALGK